MPTRRQLIGVLLAVPVVRSVAAQPGATPVPVGDAFTITWWDIEDRNPDYPVFRGDVLNTSDELMAAPVIGMTAYDANGNILGTGQALPEPPIIEPGKRAFLYGNGPEDLPDDAVLEFFPCGEPAGMTSYVDEDAALDLTFGLDHEKHGQNAFQAIGTVQNNGASPAANVAVVAMFVNPDGRIAGTLSTRLDREVPAGKSMRWKIDHGFDSYHSAHPFTRHLKPGYDVAYWVGYHPNVRITFC